MTNFLNRLAGRALGIIPVAQPIIPARFDPTAEKSVWPESTVADRMESSAESDSPATARTPFRTHEIKPSPRTTVGLREHSLPYPQAEDEPHRKETSSVRPPAAVETHLSRLRSQDTENSVAVQYANQKQLPGRELAHENAEPMPPRQTPAQSETYLTEALKDRGLHDQRGVFSEHVRSAISDPRPNQVQHPIRYPVSNQSAPSAAPVVRVTIGHIDVRAEFASPPLPTARRTRPSALSLDQYLKQRSEVGR